MLLLNPPIVMFEFDAPIFTLDALVLPRLTVDIFAFRVLVLCPIWIDEFATLPIDTLEQSILAAPDASAILTVLPRIFCTFPAKVEMVLHSTPSVNVLVVVGDK